MSDTLSQLWESENVFLVPQGLGAGALSWLWRWHQQTSSQVCFFCCEERAAPGKAVSLFQHIVLVFPSTSLLWCSRYCLASARSLHLVLRLFICIWWIAVFLGHHCCETRREQSSHPIRYWQVSVGPLLELSRVAQTKPSLSPQYAWGRATFQLPLIPMPGSPICHAKVCFGLGLFLSPRLRGRNMKNSLPWPHFSKSRTRVLKESSSFFPGKDWGLEFITNPRVLSESAWGHPTNHKTKLESTFLHSALASHVLW